MNAIGGSRNCIEWISLNKPDPQRAGVIAQQFLQKAKIEGSSEFINRVIKVAHHASKTACGSVCMQRVIALRSELKIVEGNCSQFWPASSGNSRIELNFGRGETFLMFQKSDGKPSLFKGRRVAVFVHELLHYWHWENDSIAHDSRLQSSLSNEMDNEEEMLTIAGKLTADDEIKDYCSENTIHIELGDPERSNHRGLEVKKSDMVLLPSILSSIEKDKMFIFKEMVNDIVSVRTSLLYCKGMSSLNYYIRTGNVQMLSILLDFLDTPEKKKAAFVMTDSQGRTPFHYAALSGNADCLRILLRTLSTPEEKKAALAKSDTLGTTPLNCAVLSGRAECLKVVLQELGTPGEKKAALATRDGWGMTPLHDAADKEEDTIIYESDYQSADSISIRIKLEKIPSCLNILLEILETREEKKAALNKTDNYGRTPFHQAALHGKVSCFKALLDALETPEAKAAACERRDKFGRTPLQIALKNENFNNSDIFDDVYPHITSAPLPDINLFCTII